MNILILSWRGPKHPNAGGAEISTHEHAKGWIKAGHKVTLFTSVFPGAREEEIIDGVSITRKGRQFLDVQFRALVWYLFTEQSKYDLIIDHFHGIPFFTPLYIKEKKLAFIHEVTKEVWRLNPWPWPFNLITGVAGMIVEPWILKWLYKKTPFITVSQSTKQDLVDIGISSENINVIYNGINTPKIKRGILKSRKRTLIYLGSLSKDKGIEDAIYIFKKIIDRESTWQFWIAGSSDPQYLKKIKNIASKLGVYKNITFFGYVSESQKFKLLSKAHILMNPSIREGWGLVVVEAARVGTPTVGYNVPGLRDSVINGKTGILTGINQEECAKAILDLMSSKIKYEKLRKNCIKYSKNFNWQKSSQASLKLIMSLLNK